MPPEVLPHAIALPNLLEVSAVAHKLKASPEFVRRLLREHRLPALRLGSRWRVDERDLLAYIEACRVAQKRPGEDRAQARDEQPRPTVMFQHPRTGA
jgi:excisionase family DNA binding protein